MEEDGLKAGYLTAMVIQNDHIMINQNHSTKRGRGKNLKKIQVDADHVHLR